MLQRSRARALSGWRLVAPARGAGAGLLPVHQQAVAAEQLRCIAGVLLRRGCPLRANGPAAPVHGHLLHAAAAGRDRPAAAGACAGCGLAGCVVRLQPLYYHWSCRRLWSPQPRLPEGLAAAPLSLSLSLSDALTAAQVGPGKTLWVVGDSVSRQFFAALSCLLERATGLPPRLLEAPRDRVSIPQVLLDKKGYVHKLASSTGDRLKLFDVPRCILVPTATHPDGHCTVCYVSSMISVEGLPILQRIGGDRTETVVVNWGLHGKRGMVVPHLEALLSGWRKFCRTRDGRCARLVWRETSAQHFATSAGGLYSQGASQPCVAHNGSDYSHNNKLNLAMNDTLAAYPEVLKLPVWRLTADRWDAHPAVPGKGDCTHWCAHHPLRESWLRESWVREI
jgi:hypothetical protein